MDPGLLIANIIKSQYCSYVRTRPGRFIRLWCKSECHQTNSGWYSVIVGTISTTGGPRFLIKIFSLDQIPSGQAIAEPIIIF